MDKIRVLGDIVKNAGEQFPEKDAVHYKSEWKSFGQILNESKSLASFLVSKGLQKNQRVCFFLEKRFEKVSSIWGISLSGGCFVPIRKLSLPPQVVHIFNDCGSEILITTAERIQYMGDEMANMPNLKKIILVGKREEEVLNKLPNSIEVFNWDDAVGFQEVSLPHVIQYDLAAILYTSGSTGKPKGVVLNHLNIVEGAKKVSQFLDITERDRLLSILTFGFDYGLNQLTSSFYKGAQIVLFDYLFPKDIISHSKKMEVTGLAAVATTWIQLAQIKWSQEDVPKLRYITNSGGAIPEQHVLELNKRLSQGKVFLMYGLTEAFRSTFLDPELVEKYPTSMGKAIPGEEIIIVDENNKPVKEGDVGELVHRGVLVAQGYWNAPELTAIRYKRDPLNPPEVMVPMMAVYSGDRVKLGENGLLFFVGRNDEMIKCAGNRVSPTEIEELLYNSDMLATAMAMGVPHETYGQTVFAIVVPKDSKSFDLEAFKSYCKKSMPPHMCPQGYEVRETLPQNTNGKLDRSRISKEIYADLGLEKK